MSRRWLRQQPDHYEWLSGYLHSQGWGTATRLMLVFMTASMMSSIGALWASADRPADPVRQAMMVLALAGGIGVSVLWARGLPTRRQSIAVVLISNTCVALACLSVVNPWAALLGCFTFALTGAYTAFFHGIGLITYSFTVTVTVAIFLAIRVSAAGHTALALIDLWLVVLVNIALPVTIVFLVGALGADLLGAERDPLTGLLNRRAFRYTVQGLIQARQSRGGYLVALMIDLDDFKKVNDTYGHAAGDEVLRQVALVLKSSAPDGAAVGRSGGEEFIVLLVVDENSEPDPTSLAQQLCVAIADLPNPVTASIGTAWACLHGVDTKAGRGLIKDLLNVADMAMYHAKRSGGNRFHHYGAYQHPARPDNPQPGPELNSR